MKGTKRKIQEHNNQFRITLPKSVCENKGIKKQDVASVEEISTERKCDIAFRVIIRKEPLKLVEQTTD